MDVVDRVAPGLWMGGIYENCAICNSCTSNKICSYFRYHGVLFRASVMLAGLISCVRRRVRTRPVETVESEALRMGTAELSRVGPGFESAK